MVGGPGFTGMVYDILKFGSDIRVTWGKTSTAANYRPMDVKVVGRYSDICIGDVVVRGPGWNPSVDENRDGGPGNYGIVKSF